MQVDRQVAPDELFAENPLSDEARAFVNVSRGTALDIMHGRDRRLLALVGPCGPDEAKMSDGTRAPLEYLRQLGVIAQDPTIRDNIFVVARFNMGKPRSALGPPGLDYINPKLAHRLTRDAAETMTPLAMEFMNRDQIARYEPMTTVAWPGARDVTSTGLKRTLSAYPGLPLPIKHSNLDTGIGTALAAMKTIGARHEGVDITMGDGCLGRYVGATPGNQNTGVIYRGTNKMTTDEFMAGLRDTEAQLADARIFGMADFHGVVKTVATRQEALDAYIKYVASGQSTSRGVVIESYLVEGSSAIDRKPEPGKSEYDPCSSIAATADSLVRLAEAHARTR